MLITAIGVSYFLQNSALLIWKAAARSYSPVVTGTASLLDGRLSISYISLLTIAVCVVIMLALTTFVNKSKMGKAMRACSEDKAAAQLMGINVNATISATFAIGSALAAIAGVLFSVRSIRRSCRPPPMPGIHAFTAAMPGIKAFHRRRVRRHRLHPGAFLGGLPHASASRLAGRQGVSPSPRHARPAEPGPSWRYITFPLRGGHGICSSRPPTPGMCRRCEGGSSRDFPCAGEKGTTAAVFGGIGSIPGAFLGGLLLGIIEALAKAYISTTLANAIVFAVLIVVLLVKPAGLLGRYVPEKV